MKDNDEFIKIYNAVKNGELSEDELLSAAKKIVLKKNPQLSDDKAEEIAKVIIKSQSLTSFLIGGSSDGEELHNQIKENKMEFSPETMAKLEKLMARVDELIEPVETVRLHPQRGKTTVFDSKMGGVPYFPKSMKYPVVREGELKGKPLYFLAQLNFGTLPKLPGFPTEGILQFFTGCDGDEMDYGMSDFDDEFNQNGFRVIYHENIVTDASKLYSEKDMPDFGDDEENFPFEGEFLLTAEKAEPMGITADDFRCDKVVAAAYNELFGADVDGMLGCWEKSIRNVDPELVDAIFTRVGVGTRMGGYPFFTQRDPRGRNEEYGKCTVLLFQSDSENCDESTNFADDICWGDSGVANFFISPEDLAKRDFSRVMYNWDCY